MLQTRSSEEVSHATHMTSFSHTTLWSIWPDRIRSVQNDEMLVIGCTAPFHTLILAHGPLRGLVLNCLSRFGVRKPYERPSAISTARRCMCHRRRCILKRSAHSRDSTNPILRLCAVAVTGRVIARTDCGRWRSCWSTTTGGMQGTPQVDCADGHCASCVGGMQGMTQVDCDESDWQPPE